MIDSDDAYARTRLKFPGSDYFTENEGWNVESISVGHLNKRPWWARRIPAVDHVCMVYSFVLNITGEITCLDRCSCGAWSWCDGGWQGKNSRRERDGLGR